MLKCRKKIQKIIASVLILITCMFAVPNFSQADFGGKLFSPIVDLFAGIGDVVIGALQHWMLGTSSLWSATLEYDDPNVEEMTDLIKNNQSGSLTQVRVAGKTLERGWTSLDGKYDDINVPNIIYSPELIFSNLVPALDINFLNPDDSRFVQVDPTGDTPISTGTALHEVVAAWYTAFRNIALVGLLSVLVYVGIRIVIGSSAGEKAQYRERLMDWLVALCLLFVMQYIMSFTINITEQITKIFSGSQSIDVIVEDTKVLQSADSSTQEDLNNNENENIDFSFTTNLMGYMRFLVYSGDLLEKAAYLIIYLVLVVYTVMFTIIYLKRVLYMAFFTMIAPLVALTYPLDKLSDGKAQAFNLWLREYIFNALIQPMHLALYTMLMTSSMHLATTNPIYALVAIGFLFPAEKFLKKMFGFDKTETAGGAGSFAGGAMTMALLNKMRSNASKKSGSGSGDGSDGGDYIDRGVDASAFATNNPNPTIGVGSAGKGTNMSASDGNIIGAGDNNNAGMNIANQDETYAGTNIKGAVQTDSGIVLPGVDTRKFSSNTNQQSSNQTDSNVPPVSPSGSSNDELDKKNRVKMLMGNVWKGVSRGATRKIKNAPKSVGRFALNTGVKGLKALGGAALGAVPALVTATASGGDFSTAGKIIAGAAGVSAMIGPSGDDIINKTSEMKDKLAMASGRTYEEQKDIDAAKKVKALYNNKSEKAKLQKALFKNGEENVNAEEWIDNNQDLIKEYYKKGVKNLDTVYKAEQLAAKDPSISKDYKINIAKQYDNIGKRINNAEYMQAFEDQIRKQGLTESDYQRLYSNLRFMDDF